MDDAQLDKLSLLELQDLQAQLHMAIRSRIRAQQAEMASRGGRAPTVQQVAHTEPVKDLARERDAWLARRRMGQVT